MLPVPDHAAASRPCCRFLQSSLSLLRGFVAVVNLPPESLLPHLKASLPSLSLAASFRVCYSSRPCYHYRILPLSDLTIEVNLPPELGSASKPCCRLQRSLISEQERRSWISSRRLRLILILDKSWMIGRSWMARRSWNNGRSSRQEFDSGQEHAAFSRTCCHFQHLLNSPKLVVSRTSSKQTSPSTISSIQSSKWRITSITSGTSQFSPQQSLLLHSPELAVSSKAHSRHCLLLHLDPSILSSACLPPPQKPSNVSRTC